MSTTDDAAEGVQAAHRRLADVAANPSVSETGAACSQPGCETHRTTEPEYSAIQAMTGQPLGWYSGDDGEFCPKHIAELMAMGNRRAYNYFNADGTIGATA